jgi:prepilin-type N-terminal cleavage/methylation domain-containing protein
MKRTLPVHRRFSAFTLVELLVVIAIIVVLMSLLLGAIPAVKNAQRKLEARNMANQVVVALNAYYTEYARFPIVVSTDGKTRTTTGQDTVVGDPAMNAQQPNNTLFFTLRNIPKGPNEDYAANPRKVVFFEGQAAKVNDSGKARSGFFDKTSGGSPPPSAEEGCLFDPWGKQYGVVFDASGDERIDLEGFYIDFAGDDATSGKAPRKRAGAFSMGTDETLGTKGNKTYRGSSDVSDDVVTWE